MNENRDAETGRYGRKHDPEKFLNALREHGGAAGTSEVAEHVGCPKRTAYFNLDQLREQGQITSRQIGRSMLWMVSDE